MPHPVVLTTGYFMKSLIDNFQQHVADYFRQLTLAIAYLNIGAKMISASPKDMSIQLPLDKDIATEPMYLKELLAHSNKVEDAILELFQHKMIASWNDLLNDIFSCFVEQHFSGKRKFQELRKRAPKIDFSSDTELTAQIKNGLLADFSFDKYVDRLRIINGILNPVKDCEPELSLIKKQVFIRNAIQHHEGRVYADMMRELSLAQLQLLNKDADKINVDVGNEIELSIPEIDALKRALFRISITWRNTNA